MDSEAGNLPESVSNPQTEASNQYLKSWEGRIVTTLFALSKPAALGAIVLTLGTMTGNHTEATITAGLLTAGLVWGSRQLEKEITSRTNTQPQGKP